MRDTEKVFGNLFTKLDCPNYHWKYRRKEELGTVSTVKKFVSCDMELLCNVKNSKRSQYSPVDNKPN